jgi:exonuclease III
MTIKETGSESQKLTILNVYGPNESRESQNFWKEIKAYFENHPSTLKPDVLAGDFNFVEDAMDRLPTRSDQTDIVEAFDDLKLYMRLAKYISLYKVIHFSTLQWDWCAVKNRPNIRQGEDPYNSKRMEN